MGKQQLMLLAAAMTVVLEGCSSVEPLQPTTMYARATNNTRLHYPARPIAVAYSPRAYQHYQSSFQHPIYSQRMVPTDFPVRRALLAHANQALGVSYRYGGETPREGFDCSGLTQYVYKHGSGIALPRTAAQQSAASRTVSFNQIRPGDLIFFHTQGRQINHVGIYIGRGQFIHAASGGGKVTVDNLSRPYWQQRLAKFGTFIV